MSRSLFRIGELVADGLADAPNPKPSSFDKRGFGTLANLYTAFSSEFAAHILEVCLAAGCETIADPFSGMGTIAEAGRRLPVSLRLGDISPFAALSGLFRSASSDEMHQALNDFEATLPQFTGDNEDVLYQAIFDWISVGRHEEMEALLTSPSEPEHRRAAIISYIAAASRIRLHRQLAGSNPTWIKRAQSAAGETETRAAISDSISRARAYASQVLPLNHAFRCHAKWSGIEHLNVPNGSLDAIVTSPPYPNRTDYIRHYLPASELLLRHSGREERTIRSEQIGTPLIRKFSPVRSLPEDVELLLSTIKHHKSYASEGYYHKGYLYYFSDMADAIDRMAGWLRPGGLLIMVVQDAYYKEVLVETAALLTSIAKMQGLNAVARRDWTVRQRLSSLSPHSREKGMDRALSESVIAFSR